MLPALKKTGRDLQKREEGQEPSENQKILIKATTEEPKIITFKDFIARAPPVWLILNSLYQPLDHERIASKPVSDLS
jgi:hypothetical protein